MHRKMNSLNQYEELSKQFSAPPNPQKSKIEPWKIQKGPNISQHEERKIEKCLENEIFYSTGGETPLQFSKPTCLPKQHNKPNKTHYYPNQLTKNKSE